MAVPPNYSHTAIGQGVPLAGAINGQQFVAQPSAGNAGQGPGAGTVVNQLWQQAGGMNYQPGQRQDAGTLLNNLWNQAGGATYNPGNRASSIDQANQLWQQAGGGTYARGNEMSLEALFGNLGTNVQNFDPTTNIVNSTMAGILNPGNAYIDSARRAGLEQVAARGGLNSSIGAGASQRAAIDASMPMFQSAMNLTGQREQQSWQGRENELGRLLQQQGMRADMVGQREQRDFLGTQADYDRASQRANQAFGLDTQREAWDFQGNQADMDRAAQRAQAALGLTSQREQQDFQGNLTNLEMAQQRMRDALGLQSQREGYAFQGQQAGLDRIQNVNNQLLQQQLRERQSQMDFENTRALQGDRVSQENWLADQNYTRQFNGNLAMMPITNSMQMSQAILDYAMQNPEVYSPEVISGLTNFFTGNMVSIFNTYFPNAARRQGGNS